MKTPEGFTIEEAWTIGKSGRTVRDGWDLFLGDEPNDHSWCNRYWTKHEAIEAAERIRKINPTLKY